MRELHAVQDTALTMSAGRTGFAYFMEQGLGKTYTATRDFLRATISREATRAIILCPNSFKSGWPQDAIDNGLEDAFDWHIFESGSASNKYFLNKKFTKPPALVINYEAIRSPSTMEYLKAFCKGRNVMGIADESIQISTHDAAQTKAALELSKELAITRVLSGKPMKQGPNDLWSQYRFIKQLNGRNYFAFRGAFCRMGGFKNKQVIGAQNEDILAELIDPHTFRATKADWTDLPPKLYTIRDYQMTPEMRYMYKSMEDEFVLWLKNGEAVTIDAAITKYMKLAQIQTGFIYKEDGTVEWLVEDSKNPRLNTLLEVLDNEVTGKVAIPYVHKPVLDMLLRSKIGNRAAWIKGGMTPEEIAEQKRRFNKDPDCRYILLQTVASKYGHTLLGDQTDMDVACYTMVFFEKTYSLDDRSQIEDRIHRHGQTADAALYIDLAGTPLDRNATRALQRKEGVFQAVFSLLT